MHGNRRRDKSPNANFGSMQMVVGPSVRPSAVMLALRKKESGKAERAEWGNVVPREELREEGRAVKPEKCAARHVFDGRTTQCGRGKGEWMEEVPRSLARSLALPVPALDMRQEPQAGGRATNTRQRSHVGLLGSRQAGRVCTFGRE